MKQLLAIALSLLTALACSSGRDASPRGGAGNTSHAAGDAEADSLIAPVDLTVTALEGGNGVLQLTALTLRQGPNGAEVYAALENIGELAACDAAFSVELFDEKQESMAAALSGILSRHAFRLKDGSGTLASCVGPGQTGLAAVTSFPADLAVDQVRYAVYRTPHYALDADPVDGMSVEHLELVPDGEETAYAGTLVNGLGVTLSHPSVQIFALNRVGRPLGVATGSSVDIGNIPPEGTWSFKTDSVENPGVAREAIPLATLVP